MKVSFEELNKELKALPWTCDYEKKCEQEKPIRSRFYQGLEVGDGVTVHLYSDSEAYTIIKRTAKTITLQRDIATLDPNFKPKFIEGGFCGHCVNQNEQKYTYERDPNGHIITARWSDKRGAFIYLDKVVTAGRNEFYDYNF